MLPRIRQNKYARGALDAMNAAVVALIAVVCWRLGAGRPRAGGKAGRVRDRRRAVMSLAALLGQNINAT